MCGDVSAGGLTQCSVESKACGLLGQFNHWLVGDERGW